MAKGTKRKIPIEKISKKNALATCYTKRSGGLYSKASQLCLLSGSQIAILATPSSSQSNVSFYSFGHSSVDSVVSAFLAGKHLVPAPVPSENKQMREDIGICLTRKDLGLGFWWEDERLLRSENPEEIKDAIESMSSLLTKLRSEFNHEQLKNNKIGKNDLVLRHGTQSLNQTLNLQPTSAICCIPGDSPVVDYTEEHDQILKTDTEIVVLDDDLPEERDQILAISDSFCITDNYLPAGNLDVCSSDQEMDLDQELEEFAASLETQVLNQTLNLQSSCIVPDDNNNYLLAGNLDKCNSDQDMDHNQELEEFAASLETQMLNQNLQSNYIVPDDDDDLAGNLNEIVVKNTQEQEQILAISENICNNNNVLPRGNLDEEMDFDTTFKGLLADGVFKSNQEFGEFIESLMINSQAVHDDNSTNPNLFSDSEAARDRALNEDNLRFSDVFNGLY